MDYESGGDRTATVWGKPYVIVVYRRSKSVWEAVGDYKGEQIRVTDRSAALLLRNVATYKGEA
jgi:hypothetical protein